MSETTPQPVPFEKNEQGFTQERIERLVLELESPLRDLLEKLRPDIEKGVYKIIIGEQVSGHLPALILGHAIKLVYRAKKFPSPVQGFVAGSRDQRYEAADRKVSLLAPYFSELQATVDDNISWESPARKTTWEKLFSVFEKRKAKALVISETISSGTSITPILRALRKNSVKADVAILYFDNNDEMGIDDLGKQLGARVVDAGAFPNPKDNIFLHKELTGFVKDPMEVFARPMELASAQYSQMLEVRRVANELAKRLAANFTAKH